MFIHILSLEFRLHATHRPSCPECMHVVEVGSVLHIRFFTGEVVPLIICHSPSHPPSHSPESGYVGEKVERADREGSGEQVL